MSEFKFEPYYLPKMGYIIKEDNKPKDDFIPLYNLEILNPDRFDHKYIKDVKFKPIYKSF
jgi:hypothetical protein